MGTYWSRAPEEDDMDEGRESPPRPPDDQQTTSEEGSEGAVDRDIDIQGDSSDLSLDQEDEIAIFSNPCEDFSDAIEALFVKAENYIRKDWFNQNFAKQFVLTLRDHGQRHVTRGCSEEQMEDIVVNRALTTVFQLVDGVNLKEEEVFDPRQTLVYLYCAMAVFPCSVRLGRSGGQLVYHWSPASSLCYPQLHQLNRYCALKTECEGIQGWQNLLRHTTLLLDMSAWLELEMPCVSHFMTNQQVPPLATLIQETRKIAFLPGMSGVSNRLQRLWDIGVVLMMSCLLRLEFIKEAQNLRRLLTRVDATRLSASLAARYAYVHARLLQNCGEYKKALGHAREALQGVTEAEERREIEQLINDLNNALDRVSEDRELDAPPDPEWLQGTHAGHQTRTDLQEAVRRNHHAHTSRRKVRTKSVPRRGQTPSPAPLVDSRRSRASTPGPLRDVHSRSSSQQYSSSPSLSLYSSSPASSVSSGSSHNQGEAAAFRESLLCSSDLDESDDQEDDLDQDREVRFIHEDNDESDDAVEDDEDFAEVTVLTTHSTVGGEEEELQDWFEKSEEAIANYEDDEEEGETIELSEGQAGDFRKGGEGRSFYEDWVENPEQLLRSNPDRYKRCRMKIEWAHKSIAKVLDKGCKYSDILIDGRSKAGRTYMDDEVVVEVLKEPGNNRGLQQARTATSAGADESLEKMAYGKVVGLLNRVNFARVDHPVMFCTLDEIEGHLMRPLCKTVPKIHVMNDTVKRKYPALLKNRIEIKKITSDGRVVHKGFCNVQPDKREQYVFRVVMLAWRQRNIYPLGAVLSAHISGRDYSGGLEVLFMQQRVPKRYPRTAVEDTKNLIGQSLTKSGREDLTKERLFTIDPPGSKDLDDAVSIKKQGPHYIVGVHIADVAAVVKKGRGVDLEARRRAVTYYPLHRKPHAMLPEPLSHGKCSLLPGQERLAFSVFYTFNENGRQTEEPVVKKTVIKSCQQLMYADAQKVIENDAHVDVKSSVRDDICQLHKITSKLREARQKQSMLFVPFEDPRLHELEMINNTSEAHALIEELMILTNSYIAKRLSKRPRLRDVMLVRSHKAPTYEELAEWQTKEGSVSNLVMQLQGKKVSPNTQLSLEASSARGGLSRQQNVVVQSDVWMKLCQCLEQEELEEARRLAFMDAIHPLQCLAATHWMDLMETAQYKCCYGLNAPDLHHFGLDLDIYTHFTSPIRRYADLHVQRLLHADLDGRSPDCTADDVTELCQHINSATSRQKAFGKGCMALKVAESLQQQPLVFRAFVESVDADQLMICVPSLLKIPDRKQELPFSMLGVSCQPEVTTDTILQQDSVTVQWNRRIYDVRGTCPGNLMSVWKHLEKRGSKNTTRSSAAPVVLYMNPDHLTKSLKQNDWVQILKTLVSENASSLSNVPQPLERSRRPAIAYGADYIEVDYMSSEKGDDTVSLRPVQFKRVYTPGQVVRLQMSADPKKGMLKPRVEILHTAHNASVCTQHVSEPVLSLTRFATRPTRKQQFSSYKEYVKAWMPLLEMEAAVGAGDTDGGIVIDNVTVSLKTQASSNSLLYRGSFSLMGKFCYERCIEFGGKSADGIQKEESKNDNDFPLDYLCLRYKLNCSDSVVSRVKESQVPETVDKQFTWLAHASVVKVIRKGRKEEDGGQLVVTFVLSPSSPQPPPQLMTKDGAKLTLELLPKSEVDRRAQEMILALENPEFKLAHAIAYGSSIPKLDRDHRVLGQKDENHEVYVPNSRKLPKNNPPQLEAIQKAMTNSLTIIQGPPGSGKTNTGIKLVYLFCKVNRQLEAEGKGKKTVLYCGPSNKSVDLVARELKSKLGSECPKIVRVYGSAIEAKDYPVPRGDLRSTRGMRDLKCDPALQDVALHHLIRQDGKPHAEDIAEFEKYFDKCRQQPDVYSVTSKQLKGYRKLLFTASAEEMKHYEVILCTCAVGGNHRLMEGAEDTIFQLIIDECAMSPEPHSMVPIVATKAQQVILIGDHKQLRPIIKCQPAAELGLDQSLFERLFNKFPHNTVFLGTQYRMHPEICAFPSKEFYENNLKTGYSSLWGGDLLPFWPHHPLIPGRQVPHLLVNVRGEEETLSVTTDQGNERSKSNRLEAEKVLEILTFLKREYKVDLLKVKLLTQYNAQRHLLEEMVKKAIDDNRNVEGQRRNLFEHYDKFKVNVSTVVSSQGGEWDYVIMSTVRSLPSYKIEPNPTHGWCRQNLGFITDRNQVNVAITRARRGLFIVGNLELLKCDDVWRHLVERYERMGCCFQDPSLFPPPPQSRPRYRPRHVQHNATGEWQQVR